MEMLFSSLGVLFSGVFYKTQIKNYVTCREGVNSMAEYSSTMGMRWLKFYMTWNITCIRIKHKAPDHTWCTGCDFMWRSGWQWPYVTFQISWDFNHLIADENLRTELKAIGWVMLFSLRVMNNKPGNTYNIYSIDIASEHWPRTKMCIILY